MNSSFKKLAFLITATLLIGAGCSSATAKTPVQLTPGFAWYENKDDGFKIQSPSDWETKEFKGETVPVQFYSPQEGETDTFRENLNVTFGSKLAESASLDDIVNSLKENIKNFKLEKSETVGNTKVITYTTTLEKGETKYDLKIRQTFIPGSLYQYILTYTASADGFDRFSNKTATMEKSFQEI